MRQSILEGMHLLEFTDKIQNKTDDDANDNACGQWQIERKILAFYKDISRQFTPKRQFLDTKHHNTQNHEDNPEDNYNFCYRNHEGLMSRKNR
jgi:hypothetical protein